MPRNERERAAYPRGVTVFTEEEQQYHARRRLEAEAGVEPLSALLGQALVQDAIDNGAISKIGEQIKRVEGSLYRVLYALEKK